MVLCEGKSIRKLYDIANWGLNKIAKLVGEEDDERDERRSIRREWAIFLYFTTGLSVHRGGSTDSMVIYVEYASSQMYQKFF